MSAHTDLWGLPISAENVDAVSAWNDTLMAFMAMRTDTGDNLKRAFAADPEMPIALVTKAAFLKMFAMANLDAAATKTVAQTRDVFARRDTTDRERAHLEALASWTQGDMEEACRRWEAILVDHPRDVLALKLTGLNRFYLGVGADLRDAFARAWYAWDECIPGYGFIAGSYAFGLEEAGNYDLAEPLGRRAVDINPEDVWAAHAVAHVMEMQCRPQEGLAWMEGLRPYWSNVHNFVHHPHWHRALFALDAGNPEQSLAIFDQDVWTEKVEDYLDLSNGAALLWRLRETGTDTGDRANRVCHLADKRKDDHSLVFSDCHIAIAYALSGRSDDLVAFRSDLNEAAARDSTQAKVMAEVGWTLCDAAQADAAGDSLRTVDLLLGAHPLLYRIGGSHAQRDVFMRMLIVNAIRAGKSVLARALLSERQALRPSDGWTVGKIDALGVV